MRDIPKMLNLRRGDRLGLVWRRSNTYAQIGLGQRMGSVHLLINGREVFEVTSTIAQPYPIWNLTGGVRQIRLLSDEKRSSLWAPPSVQMNRLSLYAFRHIFSHSATFSWSRHLKSPNVEIDRPQVGGNAFVKTEDSETNSAWIVTDWPPFGSAKSKALFEIEIANAALCVGNNLSIAIAPSIDHWETLQIANLAEIPATDLNQINMRKSFS